MKKLVFICFGLLILSGCKNEAKQPEETDATNPETEITQEAVVNENFAVELNVVATQAGEITLYYLKGDQKEIKKVTSVTQTIDGSDSEQFVKLQLEEDVLPTKLFISFGTDQQGHSVKIVDARVTYKESDLSITGERFFQFFNPNQFIDYDQETNTALLKEVDGRFNPMFSSRKVLDDRIDMTF